MNARIVAVFGNLVIAETTVASCRTRWPTAFAPTAYGC